MEGLTFLIKNFIMICLMVSKIYLKISEIIGRLPVSKS